MVTGYVYSLQSMYVIVEITGETRQVENYVNENYDSDTYGLTFSPAFGFSDSLIDNNDKEVIEL